jgi:chaperonin cofactor prefoldin
MDAELKTYLDGKFSAIDRKFDAVDKKFDAIDGKFSELRIEIDARFKEERAERRAEIEKTETALLRAFHNWARSMEIRVRDSNTTVTGLDQRLSYVEERVSELERRKPS